MAVDERSFQSGPTGICCTHWLAPGQNIGMSSGGGATPMARAPTAIVATAVTVTATVPSAVCSRRLYVKRSGMTVFMVSPQLLLLVVS
jgi:hypothetical protein